MCGIFAIFNIPKHSNDGYRTRALTLSKRLRHRGPDWSGIKCIKNHIITHERLAIVGVDSGAQPLMNKDGSIILTVNGEIYNHLYLRTMLKKQYDFKTNSDCEVLLYLYEEQGADFVKHLDGMFAFCLYDSNKEMVLIARDPIGICTLYLGFSTETQTLYVASEMKAIHDEANHIISFPPGHRLYAPLSPEPKLSFLSLDIENSQVNPSLSRYYQPTWYDDNFFPTPESTQTENGPDYALIRKSLHDAVRKRLMCEVPFGVLLSGGLDSSLIASITVRELHKAQGTIKGNDNDLSKDAVGMHASSWWPKLHSFSIGLPNAPDLMAAKKAADYLGTIHHSFTFEFEEGLDAISDVIWHLESYDVTTIRASTPMFLLSRRIKSLGVKMVLSGEGADEIYGGYLYFASAPNEKEFHKETVTRVKNLHLSDCLRANKSTMAWGLEARVPFLDTEFLNVSLTQTPAHHKMHRDGHIEKHILRKAFDTPEYPYLPDSILWRQKEQFSDGVGYSWIDGLKEWCESQISDAMLREASKVFPKDTPTTKEAYVYRTIFEKHFSGFTQACVSTVMRWIPRKDWGCNEDPSGRAQKTHAQAYEHILEKKN